MKSDMRHGYIRGIDLRRIVENQRFPKENALDKTLRFLRIFRLLTRRLISW